MKGTKEQIDDVRALLNEMVSCKDIELTDIRVVELSERLDKLINIYIQEQSSE